MYFIRLFYSKFSSLTRQRRNGRFMYSFFTYIYNRKKALFLAEKIKTCLGSAVKESKKTEKEWAIQRSGQVLKRT